MSEWHFVRLPPGWPDNEDDDIEAEWLHPESCGVRIEIGTLPGPMWERLCGVAFEVGMVGEEELLGGDQTAPGWYAVRHWRTERAYAESAFSEVETGIEMITLAAFASQEAST